MADEIGKAFQKVGGSAGALDIPFEKAASWIAVVSSRTRESAETIGQSIKGILARVQSLKENGFDETDGTQVNEVAKALAQVNIQLMDSNGQFRNFGTIMDELGGKWDSLDSRTKAYLATTVAGTYQQSRFLNLMEGYKDTIPLYENALNSAGTTTQKFNLYLQGNEAALNKFKATWEGLWMSTFNSDAIKLVIEGLTGLASMLKKVGDTFGSLPTVFGVAGVAILAFNGGLKSIMANGVATIAVLRGLPTGLTRFDSALAASTLSSRLFGGTLKGLSLSFSGLKTAFTSTATFLAGAIWPIAAFAAIGWAIQKVTDNLAKQLQEEEQIKQQQETIISNYKKRKSEVAEMVSEYEKLSDAKKESGGKLDTTDQEKYTKLQNDLAKILPSVKIGEDAKGNAILKSSEAIKEQISLLEKQIKLQKEKKQLDAPKKIKSNEDTINDESMWGSETGGLKQQLEYSKKISDSYADDLKNAKENKLTKSEILEIQGLQNIELTKQSMIQGEITAKTQENAQYIKSYLANLKLNPEIESQIASLMTSIDFTGKDIGQIQGIITSVVAAISNLKEAMSKGDAKGIKNAKNELDDLLNSYSNGKLSVNDFTNVLKQNSASHEENSKATSNTKNQIANLTKELENAKGNFSDLSNVILKLANAGDYDQAVTAAQTDAYKAMADEISPLNGLLETLAQGKSISADEAMNLIAKEGELANAISIENGVVKVNQDAVINLRNAKIAAYQDMINAIRAQVQAQSTGLVTKLKNYGVEIKAIMSVAEANEALAAATAKRNSQMAMINASNDSGVMYASNVVQNQYDKVASGINEIKAAYAQLENLSALAPSGLASVGTSNSSGSGNKSGGSGSGSSEREVEIYQIDKYKQKMDELNNSIEESEFLTKRLDHTSSLYRSELEKQSKTYKEMSEYTLGQIKSLEDRNTALQSQISSMGDVNKLSNDQKEIFNNLTKELEDNTAEVYQLKDAWRGYQEQMLAMQDDLRDSIAQQIADEEAARVAILEQELEDVNQQYEDKIGLLEDQLDLLEETEEVEDRIAKLREKDDEISKAKSDKRYSYITAQGEEILTYNKEQVSELEKERDEMVKQYERADLKKAIQDEIDRLNKEKEEVNKTLQKRLDDFKKFWDNLVAQAKSGTLSFTTLMQAWNDTTISSLTEHVNQTGVQLNNIGEMYNSLGVIATNLDQRTQQINTSLYTAQNTMNTTLSSMNTDLNNATNTLGSTLAGGLNNMLTEANKAKDGISSTLDIVVQKYKLFTDAYNKLMSIKDGNSVQYLEAEKLALRAYSQLPQHHEGGTVGSLSTTEGEFANKLFGAKPNEQVAKLLKGEVVINPMLPNVKNNIRNLQSLLMNGKQPGSIDQSKNNFIQKVEIKANNPMEMFNGLNTYLDSV